MNTLRPIRILIVDDDKSMASLLKRTIDSTFGEQLITTTVDDPTAARDVLESDLVDVLVTDLDMPTLDGLCLLQIAKKRNAWTQVVLITAHSSCTALTQAMELGASDYLVKPMHPEMLTDVIRQTCRRLMRWQHALVSTMSLTHG